MPASGGNAVSAISHFRNDLAINHAATGRLSHRRAGRGGHPRHGAYHYTRRQQEYTPK